MRLLYSIAISIYALAVRCASLFDGKAKLLRAGWHQWRRNIDFGQLDNCKVAWFHASSLGEFEQARPVMEAFRKRYADYKILLTFFSPSGFEVRKKYDGADLVCYLPPDTMRNSHDFVRMAHPDIAFFVKYDFWFNYLNRLSKGDTKPVPTFLFSAIFRPSQYFFRWYGRWFSSQLDAYTHIFVQNSESVKLLNSIGITRCTIAGDTRFDRVADIAHNASSIPSVERFVNTPEGAPILIAGSSWPADEQNIKSFVDRYNKPLKLVIAPHLIDGAHLTQILNLFGNDNSVLYSQLSSAGNDSHLYSRQVLVIDNIGMLSAIYRYATVAYIGGGFGKGIHNTLEAAVYNIPVCFGPNYLKFQEAKGLIQCGAARSYTSPRQLYDILDGWLGNEEGYRLAAQASKAFMDSNLGATQLIMERVCLS